MKKKAQLFTITLIIAFFSLSAESLWAMVPKEERSDVPKSVPYLSTPVTEEGIHASLQHLAAQSLPPPAILGERLLSTPDQHVQFLKAALRSSYERVVIVSPYISLYRLRENDEGGFYNDIEEAAQRGVKITVFTDVDLDKKPDPNNGWRKLLKPNAAEGRKNLVKAYVDLRIVDRIHSKNLIVDDNLITFGSFNWLSAVTNSAHEWCRYETSTVIKDDYAPIAILRLLGELEVLPVRDTEGYHAFYLETTPATTDFREAIALYKKYSQHPLYKSVTRDLMSSHSELGLNEGLSIILALQETGASQIHLLQEIQNITEFHVGDAKEFIRVLEVLHKIDPISAKDAALDEDRGLLSRIDRGRDFDELDNMYSVLVKMSLEDLANRLESYILGGVL